MKMGIVCRYLPPHTDGVGDYAFRLAAALARKGVETHLITSVGQAAAPGETSVRIHPVVEEWGWRGIRGLARWIAREGFDVVDFQYVPHLYSPRGLQLAGAALPLKIRSGCQAAVITTCHELLGHQPQGFKAHLLELVHRTQAALLLAGSARIVVPVVWQERRLLQFFPAARRKVRRIPVGPSIVPVKEETAPPASSLGKILLGTFGSGHSWWQYEMALEILRGLRRRGTDARLLLLGNIQETNPSYYETLRRKEASLGLQAWTEWTGRLPEKELSRRLASLDLFLALQRTGVTARSTALVSALAHGLAIVATHGPDSDPWLIDSGAMRIIDPCDIHAAVEAAHTLALNSEERRVLRRRAAALYSESFSWEKISSQFLALLEELKA